MFCVSKLFSRPRITHIQMASISVYGAVRRHKKRLNGDILCVCLLQATLNRALGRGQASQMWGEMRTLAEVFSSKLSCSLQII